jgi:hypothetical protein
MKRICAFCGSSPGSRPEYRAAARKWLRRHREIDKDPEIGLGPHPRFLCQPSLPSRPATSTPTVPGCNCDAQPPIPKQIIRTGSTTGKTPRLPPEAASFKSLYLNATSAYSQSGEKKKVNSQADLPRFSYPMAVPASELVRADDATFNAFVTKVHADLDTIFRDYSIDHKATLRTLLSVKLDLQQLAGEDQAALQTIDTLRSFEEKPAAKLIPASLRSHAKTSSQLWLDSVVPLGGEFRGAAIEVKPFDGV